MITIIYIFYVDNFSTYNFILDLHNHDHIFIMFFKNYCSLSQYSYTTYISYYFENKRINVLDTYSIRYRYVDINILNLKKKSSN